MEKIKTILSDLNKDKCIKIVAVLTAAISIIYVCYFFFANAFEMEKGKAYNLYFAIILFTMISLILYMLRLIVFDKEWKYGRTFIILALGWSLCMQFVMPPISGADEVQHYYSAYHSSNLMMGMKDHNFSDEENTQGKWVDGQTFFYMRAEDYYMMQYIDVTFPYQYAILARGNWIHHADELQENVECYAHPGHNIRYLFSGLGITIARLLKLGFAGTIFLGRFMNSLSLILAGWFCIKILPIGKLQVVMFSLFPTILQLCGSYSYDNMSILMSMIFLCLCLYYSREEVKLHAWDLLILGGCLASLAPNKMVYVLFAPWIFMIPAKKWWKDVCLSKKWYEYSIIAAFVVAVIVILKKYLGTYLYLLHYYFTMSWDHQSIETDVSLRAYTLEDVKADPLGFLKFAWEGIKVDFWYNIKHVVGSELGHIRLNAAVPIACIIVILVVFLIGIVFSKGHRLSKRQYIWLGIGLLACMIAIFMGCLVRFTPAEGSQRIQISYRYIIPVYMCLTIALGTNQKENKLGLVMLFIENIALAFSMCGLLYFLFHLRDGMGVPEILMGIMG